MPLRSPAGVICLGNISFDIPVWPVEHFNWGTTTWVQAVEQNIGGNGGNTATALAILGAPVRLYGKIGRDAHGEAVLEQLIHAGVDIGRVARSHSPTNCTVCLVHPSGDRLFFNRPGASGDVEAAMLPFDDGPPFTHFHLANLFSLPSARFDAAAILARARAAGLTTSLDAGWDALGRWTLDFDPCLPHADLVFVNESEALHLTGESAPERACGVLRARGARDVVVKLGGRGCAAFWDDRRAAVPAFVVEARDTTGAGDSFVAAFLAALHRGRDYPAAARFANAVGALSVERLGAVVGVRSFEETERWMASAPVGETDPLAQP